MKSLIKWIGGNALTAIFWVFILSINYEGRTLFSYAHELVVQNDIVRDADEKLEQIWSDFYHKAQRTYAEFSQSPKDKSTN